jgi:hypothetical protein
MRFPELYFTRPDIANVCVFGASASFYLAEQVIVSVSDLDITRRNAPEVAGISGWGTGHIAADLTVRFSSFFDNSALMGISGPGLNNSVPDGVLYAIYVGIYVSDCRFSGNMLMIQSFQVQSF